MEILVLNSSVLFLRDLAASLFAKLWGMLQPITSTCAKSPFNEFLANQFADNQAEQAAAEAELPQHVVDKSFGLGPTFWSDLC